MDLHTTIHLCIVTGYEIDTDLSLEGFVFLVQVRFGRKYQNKSFLSLTVCIFTKMLEALYYIVNI